MRTTGEVAKELGVSLWALLRLVYSGVIDPTPARVGNLRAWSPADVEAARRALARRRQPAESCGNG
jgi:hypothetical protein